MQPISLPTLADQQLGAARQAASGRSAHTIHGGHQQVLRQTLLALAAGRSLDEHDSPGEASLQVLSGQVRLATATQSWEATTGDYLVLPTKRHSLTALDDSAVLLTVALHDRTDH
jgi:quercetin dioxygenase-like cupin family protein